MVLTPMCVYNVCNYVSAHIIICQKGDCVSRLLIWYLFWYCNATLPICKLSGDQWSIHARLLLSSFSRHIMMVVKFLCIVESAFK